MSLDVLRFALLRHTLPEGSERLSHWDLLLERDGVALTWALEVLPAPWQPGAKDDCVVARRLADHRLLYLDFEGPLSNDRGHVARLAWGGCQWLCHSRERMEVQLTCAAWTVHSLLIPTDNGDEWHLTVQRISER
jgi:hypothetical protein